MAAPRLAASIVKRSAGHSIVQRVSYQSGIRLYDERNGTTRYPPTKRLEDLRYTELMLPKGAPDWDRERVWNEAANAERYKNAQEARTWIASLPVELPEDWRQELAREFARRAFVDKNMACDIAIHDKGLNPHAHYATSMRELGSEGFAKTKNRSWNHKNQLKEWRSLWAEVNNEFLEDYGSDVRIDMRSYRAQGIDRLPQRHLGNKAHRQESMGVETPTGNYNRRVRHLNLVVGIDYRIAPEQVIQLEQYDREIEHARPLERGAEKRREREH